MNRETYLAHYGVKGQKWGVRRYQNKDGTLTAQGRSKYGNDISKRKAKQVKKQFRAGIKSKAIDTSSINKKVNDEVNKSKEGKAQKAADDYLEAMYKSAESQGIQRHQIVFDKSTADFFNGVNDRYNNKLKEVANSHIDEYASVTLKSLGYKDTKAGREWLKKQNFMEW